ncbi:MAG: oligosaccharide flippase family protein [Verrucomicrobiota bacterium]
MSEPRQERQPEAGRQILTGTARLFLAEALVMPTGLVLLAVLTRQLGATQYGIFALAVTVVGWVEWGINALFSRATFKCIGETTDWQPLAAKIVQLNFVISLAAAGLLAILAKPIATLLGEPALAMLLVLFALDIPLFGLAQAHRHILVGLGNYRARAILSAIRWIARLGLITAFVAGGLSVTGAILGNIAASLVELGLARHYVRPRWWSRPGVSARRLWEYAGTLVVSALCLRLLDKLDLFMLKALGETAAAAGVYNAAQSLSVVPGLFALSFSPLLLSSLTRLLRDGDEPHAKAMARDSLRLVILLLPFGGLVAATAPEIARLIMGAPFAGAAPVMERLIFAALALVMISVGTSILIAAGKPRWPVLVTLPMVALAAGGLWWTIPRFGAVGAATVTMTVALLGAVAIVALVYRCWKIAPALASVFRSVLLAGLAYGGASVEQLPGCWVVLKLGAGALLVAGGFVLLGEFSARERRLALSYLPWKRAE